MKKVFAILVNIYKFILFTTITISLAIIAINITKITSCISATKEPYLRIQGNVDSDINGYIDSTVSGDLDTNIRGWIDAYIAN